MYGMLIDGLFLAAERALERRGLLTDIADCIMEYAFCDILHGVQLQEAGFSGPRGAAVARWVFKLPLETRCIEGRGRSAREQLWRITNVLVAHILRGSETYPIPYSVSWTTSVAPCDQTVTGAVRRWFLATERVWAGAWPFWTLGMQRTRHPDGEYPPTEHQVPACVSGRPWPSGYPVWQRRLTLKEPVVERGKCGARSTASGSPCQVRVSPHGYDYCKEHGGWEYEGMWPLETGAFCARCIMLPFWPAEFQVKCPTCLS